MAELDTQRYELTGKHIALLLVGSTPEERKANLRDFLIKQGVSPYNPGKYSQLITLFCKCGKLTQSWKTLDDVPYDQNIKCNNCGNYLIAVEPDVDKIGATKVLWDYLME